MRRIVVVVLSSVVFMGCSGPMAHYAGIERSLLAGQPEQAIQIMQAAKKEYGSKSRLLFLMDQGMVLHLAGQYAESNVVLEEAHLLIEDQYTKHLRDEAASLLVNEARQPYEGAPYEHVMVNVVMALNYAVLQQWNDALVEARRIDHRLNVLSDKEEGKERYHEDPFARYLVGLLYDITGDINNAYVGYRKAEQVYQDGQGWTRVPLPDVLKSDLIRTANRLGLPEEAKRYQEQYPEVATQLDARPDRHLAQLLILTYHGHGPKKEDLYIDVPISLDALRLVAFTKPGLKGSTKKTRGGEALLYGIHGRIARIALPQFTLNKKSQTFDTIQVSDLTSTVTTQSQRMYDINAVAEKNLADEYDSLVLRAVARTAMKMAAASYCDWRTLGRGEKNGDWIGLLVGGLARVIALATEEADIRSWRTLPGEIQLARIWVEPGDYSVAIDASSVQGSDSNPAQSLRLHLEKGETQFLLRQIGP